MSEEHRYPNILSVSGEGRNVGKTLLVCDIIVKFSRMAPITGIKITPHFHRDTGSAELVSSVDGVEVYRETDLKGSKDTSRMLAAGAEEAYFIQFSDDRFMEALNRIGKIVQPDTIMVCESGRLPATVKPGVSLFVRQLNCQTGKCGSKQPPPETDRIVTYSINSFDIDLNSISITNSIWKISNNNENANAD